MLDGRPRRHPRGRQGHAHEVRAAQGAAPRRRPADDRARARPPPRRSRRARRPSSSAIRRTRCEPALAAHRGLTFVVQEPQLGTAHALLTTEPALARRDGHAGAAVRRRAAAVARNAAKRWSIATTARGAAATVVTAVVDDPHGYGRIVRSGEQIARIVEERDATPGRARDSRNQLRHLRVRARRAVRRGARHRRRERAAASTTCPISSRSTGSAGAASKP